MPPAPSRVFTITELQRTGAGVLEPTPVVFRWPSSSHAAPHDVIEHALKVKTVRTEDPGSDEPTEQVLAATWQPFDLMGEWNDQYGGPGFATNTYRDFGRLVARGSEVRIEIEELSLTGIITDFVPRYQRQTAIGWRITFSPHRNDTVGNQRVVGPVASPTTRPLSTHIIGALDLVTLLGDSEQAAAIVPRSTFVDKIRSGLDRINTLQAIVARLENTLAVGLAVDGAHQLLSLAGQFRALTQGALDLAKFYRGDRGADQAGTGDPVLELRMDEHTHNAQANAIKLAARGLDGEADARARAAAKVRAVYRPFVGESLYRISDRFYGTPDEWRLIYDANNLRGLLLDGTEELVIPERAA